MRTGVDFRDSQYDRHFPERTRWARVLQSGKRVVRVTQGTIATNADELIRPTLETLACKE